MAGGSSSSLDCSPIYNSMLSIHVCTSDAKILRISSRSAPLMLLYSSGNIKGAERDEIRSILASEVQTWMDSIELLIGEQSKEELLPPAIYMVGGGSALPDLHEKLENFPWKERLPFSRDPLIETIQPGMVTTITDPNHLLKSAQDITPMALAYQAIELQDENNVLERALNRVIHRMHI